MNRPYIDVSNFFASPRKIAGGAVSFSFKIALPCYTLNQIVLFFEGMEQMSF